MHFLRQNIRVTCLVGFTIAISTEPDSMGNAAERLLGLAPEQIQEQFKDILLVNWCLVIATMTIEEINSDRDKLIIFLKRRYRTEKLV